MSGMRYQLLAAASFSINQNRGRGPRCTDNFVLHFQNLRAVSDNPIQGIYGILLKGLKQLHLAIQFFQQ